MTALVNKYEDWVRGNSTMFLPAMDFLKHATMFLPGRYGEGAVQGEAIYSALNLINHYHDGIVGKPRNSPSELLCGDETLATKVTKSILSVCEYTEVLVEMKAMAYFTRIKDLALREKKKWLVILYVEALKAACRLVLLWNNNGRMICAPSETQMLLMLEEKKLDRETKKALEEFEAREESKKDEFDDLRLMYLRHGRGKSYPHGRFLLHAAAASFNSHPRDARDFCPPFKAIISEIVYTLRPSAYVFARLNFLSKSWKPFFVSLFMDVLSRQLIPSELSPPQKIESSRRANLMMYYLFRSPFFERFTQTPIVKLMKFLQRIPLVGYLGGLVIELLLTFQQYYFYTSAS